MSQNKQAKSESIPVPKKYPLLGNLPSVISLNDSQLFHQYILDQMHKPSGLGFAKKIFMLQLPGQTLVTIANPEYLAQVGSRTNDFGKRTNLSRNRKYFEARDWIGKGLFTTNSEENEWQIAHRVVAKAFSAQAIKSAMPIVVDVVGQMVKRWAQLHAEGKTIDLPDWTARMTSGVVAKWAFGLDLNIMEGDGKHPLLEQILIGAQLTEQRSQANVFNRGRVWKKTEKELRESVTKTSKFFQNLMAERRKAGPTDHPDILERMMFQADPQTGEKLSDDVIVSNILTFMYAGHDSTSTTITNILFHITQNPAVETRLRKEIQEVCGDKLPTPDTVNPSTMPYLEQVIKEGLRIFPPASATVVEVLHDCVLDSFKLKKDWQVVSHFQAVHFDPQFYPNPRTFNPDNFAPEAEAARPTYTWLPFGVGMRACIGLQLALLETRVAVVMALQNFNLRLSPESKPVAKTDLFQHWVGIKLVASPRDNVDQVKAPIPMPLPDAPQATTQVGNGEPVYILYGSNMGTCEGIALELEGLLTSLRYEPIVRGLDAHLQSGEPFFLPGVLTVIVTSTYNGQPPNNATKFAAALANNANRGPTATAKGAKLALFGCGNSQWATYQKFSNEILAALTAAGAEQFVEAGFGDAAKDLDGAISAWKKQLLGALSPSTQMPSSGEVSPIVTVDVSSEPADEGALHTLLCEEAEEATVVDGRELNHKNSSRSTRHIAVQLPATMPYKAGSHLLVIPKNRSADVDALAARLKINPDSVVLLLPAPGRPRPPTHFPWNRYVTVRRILTECVELNQRCSRDLVAHCAAVNRSSEKGQIEALLASMIAGNDLPWTTPLEFLGLFKSVEIGLDVLLSTLPPMKPRLYSISSSELVAGQERIASISVGRVQSGNTAKPFEGLCSSFLGDLPVGSSVAVAVRGLSSEFHLPIVDKRPLILIGPGTGYAPMRGFLQEIRARDYRGKVLLFRGCRHKEDDYIYEDEMDAAVSQGLEYHLALSRAEAGKVYVQHLLWENRKAVWAILSNSEHPGLIYVCGDARRMAADVSKTFERIAEVEGSLSTTDAVAYVRDLSLSGRYLQDVWASST